MYRPRFRGHLVDGVEGPHPEGDVVGKDAELLPGAVGPVVAGRDDVERELALEFGDCLLLGPAAADKGVAGRLLVVASHKRRKSRAEKRRCHTANMVARCGRAVDGDARAAKVAR